MNFSKIRNKANKNITKNILKNNSGFTLIETLIAITLISLIGIPVFMALSDTIGFSKKIEDLNRWNQELIYLERVLRESVGEVHIPFWIGDIKLIEEAGKFSVPYWNGDDNSFLEIKIEDTDLKISTSERSTVFKGYDGMEPSLLKDSGSRTIGLSITVRKRKKEDVKFQCVFGSIGRDLFN